MADELDLLLFTDYFDYAGGRKPREILERANPFEEYDDEKFRERFRFTKPAVLHILAQVNMHWSVMQYSLEIHE